MLASCDQLQHVMLTLELANPDDKYHIDAGQLPPRAPKLWLDQICGQLVLDVRAADALRVRVVENLSFHSDPVKLETGL